MKELPEVDFRAIYHAFSEQQFQNDEEHAKESQEESDLSGQHSRIDFKVKKAYISKTARNIPIIFRHFFMNGKSAEVIAFGYKGNFEFNIRGELFTNGETDLDFRSVEKKMSFKFAARFVRNEGSQDLELMYEDSGNKLVIRFDLDPWDGYYMENEAKQEMKAQFKIDGNHITGLSSDPKGTAIWHGTCEDNNVELVKHYIMHEPIKFRGKYSPEEKSIKGRWEDGGSGDEFCFKQNEKKEPQEEKIEEKVLSSGSACCNVF